jgi:hypothetical protein
MKKLIQFTAAFFLLATLAITLASFKGDEKNITINFIDESCTKWDGTGIQFQLCTKTTLGTSLISRTHEFYNGYNVKIHFYFKLDYADGTNSGDSKNIYLDPEEYSGKAANDNYAGVNQKCTRWTITKKYKQNADGKWEQF